MLTPAKPKSAGVDILQCIRGYIVFAFLFMNIFLLDVTLCIPFSVICFLSQSGMISDGYRRGYVSFAHFCYIFQ